MLPKTHFILSSILVIILYLFFPKISLIGLFIILASAVLIDVDHYLYYVWVEKDWNLKRAFHWHSLKRKEMLNLPRNERKFHKKEFCFLHGFDVLLILFLLGRYVYVYFYYVLIGFSFHLFLDLTMELIHGFKLNKISAIYDFSKTHKDFLKRQFI